MWREAFDDCSFSANQKLCEIPLDLLTQKTAFFFFEPVKERSGMRTVDIDLSKSRKGRSVVKTAKAVDFCGVSRSLLAKLIAREIQDFKSIFLIALIEFLQFLILRSEVAVGRCIDNQPNLSSLITHFFRSYDLFLEFDIINVCHVLPL